MPKIFHKNGQDWVKILLKSIFKKQFMLKIVFIPCFCILYCEAWHSSLSIFSNVLSNSAPQLALIKSCTKIFFCRIVQYTKNQSFYPVHRYRRSILNLDLHPAFLPTRAQPKKNLKYKNLKLINYV